jgi:hypothetical protein
MFRSVFVVLHFELLCLLFLFFLLLFLLLISVTFHSARSNRPLSATLNITYIEFIVIVSFDIFPLDLTLPIAT